MLNELEKILNEKKTENGDISYKSTGDKYLDILFMSEYFTKHLKEVPTIDKNEYGRIYFISDLEKGTNENE